MCIAGTSISTFTCVTPGRDASKTSVERVDVELHAAAGEVEDLRPGVGDDRDLLTAGEHAIGGERDRRPGERERRRVEHVGVDRGQRARTVHDRARHEVVDGLAAVRDLALVGLVGERQAARVDRVAVLVEYLLAAEVGLDLAARVDDRVAGDVQHRVAGGVHDLLAVRVENHLAGEEVAHRVGGRVAELAPVIGSSTGSPPK